jgi:hypothetical protein
MPEVLPAQLILSIELSFSENGVDTIICFILSGINVTYQPIKIPTQYALSSSAFTGLKIRVELINFLT